MTSLYTAVISLLCWNIWFTVPFAESCTDSGYFCWIWKNAGRCVESSDYAITRCKKSCDLCPVATAAPTTTQPPPTSIPDNSTAAPDPLCHYHTFPISREGVKDKELLGHVTLRQPVASEFHCEDVCLRVPGCIAYNYEYKGIAGNKECKVLDRVTDVSYKYGSSFRFFERERVSQVLLSCLPW